MSDIDLDHPTRGIDWRRTPGSQVRSRLVVLADAVKAAEAERDAYREILEEMAEWIDLMERPGPLALVSRERIRAVLAGVVSTREKESGGV